MNVKLLLVATLGLTQAEGWKAPTSDWRGRTGGASSPWGMTTGFSTGETKSSVLSSLEFVARSESRVFSSSLVLLLRLDPVSGLSRDLLLESLVLPGGGEEDEPPSNEESCKGGRELRDT